MTRGAANRTNPYEVPCEPHKHVRYSPGFPGPPRFTLAR